MVDFRKSNEGKTEEHADITVKKKWIKIKLDSGSESNIMFLNDFKKAAPKRSQYATKINVIKKRTFDLKKRLILLIEETELNIT